MPTEATLRDPETSHGGGWRTGSVMGAFSLGRAHACIDGSDCRQVRPPMGHLPPAPAPAPAPALPTSHPHPHPHPHPPSPTRRTCPRTVARPTRLRPHRVRDPCRSRRCSGRFHPRFAHIFRLPQARVSDSLPTSSHFVPTYIWYPGATAMLHVAWLLHPRCRRRCKAVCLGGLIREIFPYFVAKWGEVG